MFCFQRGELVIRCKKWCVEVVVENTAIQGTDTEMSNIAGWHHHHKHEGECWNPFICVDIYMRTEQLTLTSISTPRLHYPLLWISPMKLGYSLRMFYRHNLEHIIYNRSLKDSRLDSQWNTEWWQNTSEFSWIINTSSYFFHLKQ